MYTHWAHSNQQKHWGDQTHSPDICNIYIYTLYYIYTHIIYIYMMYIIWDLGMYKYIYIHVSLYDYYHWRLGKWLRWGNALGEEGAQVLAETLPSCEVTFLQLESYWAAGLWRSGVQMAWSFEQEKARIVWERQYCGKDLIVGSMFPSIVGIQLTRLNFKWVYRSSWVSQNHHVFPLQWTMK